MTSMHPRACAVQEIPHDTFPDSHSSPQQVIVMCLPRHDSPHLNAVLLCVCLQRVCTYNAPSARQGALCPSFSLLSPLVSNKGGSASPSAPPLPAPMVLVSPAQPPSSSSSSARTPVHTAMGITSGEVPEGVRADALQMHVAAVPPQGLPLKPTHPAARPDGTVEHS